MTEFEKAHRKWLADYHIKHNKYPDCAENATWAYEWLTSPDGMLWFVNMAKKQNDQMREQADALAEASIKAMNELSYELPSPGQIDSVKILREALTRYKKFKDEK